MPGGSDELLADTGFLVSPHTTDAKVGEILHMHFCDLRTETIQMLTFCLLPNLRGFKRLGEPKAAVEYDPQDLLDFITRNFGPLNAMMERAGMSEMDIYHRTRDIFLYYGLPFNQPPPVE